MALIKYNTGDGGTNGTAVTVGNSGGASGDAWTNVVGGTNVWTYSNTQTVKGGMAYRCVQGSGVAAAMQMTMGSSLATHYGRAYIYMTAFAASSHPVVKAFGPSFVNGWRFEVNATGKIRTLDAGGTVINTSTPSITLNAWWRLEWRVVSGTGTSGQIELRVYSGDATTPTITYTNSACNTGASTDYIHYGPSLATPQVPTMYMDEIATDGAAFIGPANIVNQTPTANAGLDQTVLQGALVTLNGTGSSDTDGTIASYAWSQTSGTTVTLSSASAAQPTFTAPNTGTTLVFELTVTDNSGGTGTDSVSITVLPSIIRQNSAEGGTPGATVTTGNSGSGSGDAWQAISGSAWTYSATRTARGSVAYKCDQQAGVAAVLQWQLPTLTEHYGRIYFYVSDFAASTDPFVRGYATGFAEAFRIEINSLRQLTVRDTNATARYVGTNTLVAGTWYRLEWHTVASTTAGQLQTRLYVGDSTTPIENFSSATNLSTQAETSWLQFGPSFALTPAPGSKWFDELAVGTATSNWIGSAAGTAIDQAPVVVAGEDAQAEPGATYQLAATAVEDGTIASWSWRQISGTAVTLSSATAQNPTFTVPKVQGGATLVFGVTATDNHGLTSAEDTVTITALTPTLFYARSGTWRA